MTEPTDLSDYPALEELLDKALAKYIDPRLHRWTYVPAAADRGDLASDLADAARQHFTGGAIEKLNEDRGRDPRVRICTGAAQLAEWATARIAETNGQIGDVSSGDEVGRELIEEVHEALGILFAAGYAAMGEPSVVDGFRLRDVLALIDWVGDRGHLTGEGDPSTDGFRRLRAVRSGFIDRDPGEAPDVGLVALRPGERIVSAIHGPTPAGLARKVGRLLCEESPDSPGWCAYHRSYCTPDGPGPHLGDHPE